MRTRRSWRNQERLWKTLGKEGQQQEKAPIPQMTEEQVHQMFWMPKFQRIQLIKEIKKRNANPSPSA